MVNLTASTVGVTLPYESSYFGSHSTIHVSRLPLFVEEHSTNMRDFTLALQLLNYNVAYLCYTQGVDVNPGQLPQTFLNMFRCLNSPHLGKLDSFLTLCWCCSHTCFFSVLLLPYSVSFPKQDFVIEIPDKFQDSLFLRSSEFFSSLGEDEWDMVQQPAPPTPSSDDADMQHWIKANNMDQTTARRGSFMG